MRLPAVEGTIRRRLLLNFRVDPAIVARQLPAPFTPKLHNGQAIAGICLIRLEAIRPQGFPRQIGLSSENAAHRIAVQWPDPAGLQEGVFVPRRDTDSRLSHWAGGRVFPGEHQLATFSVQDEADTVRLEMQAVDRSVAVRVEAEVADRLPEDSCFSSVEEASEFFEPGSLGYSLTRVPGKLHGVELRTRSWSVKALAVHEVYSSYFADSEAFPAGSVTFDHGLIMRNIEHEWHGSPDLYVEAR